MLFRHDVGFQCARVSAQKSTMKFRKSTVEEAATGEPVAADLAWAAAALARPTEQKAELVIIISVIIIFVFCFYVYYGYYY